jgi:hypothetical protein
MTRGRSQFERRSAPVLVRRPIRPADKLAAFPGSTERKVKPQDCAAA